MNKIPSLLTILIVDVKSGTFRYQSRRTGEDAKKRKSPAKSGRVGISVKCENSRIRNLESYGVNVSKLRHFEYKACQKFTEKLMKTFE